MPAHKNNSLQLNRTQSKRLDLLNYILRSANNETAHRERAHKKW